MDSVELRKLFVGGLSDQTNEETLRNHFSQYGNVRQATLVRDKETGASKRFGFVEFADRLEADKAVEAGEHHIDGKKIDVKLAVGKPIVDAIKSGAFKLFIGGIPKDVDRDGVINFFNSHPLNVKVAEFELKTNRETKLSRGFGFLTPATTHHLAKLAHVQHFTIREGQKTECVLANENQAPGSTQRGGFVPGGVGRGGGRGGAGGRGGGRGGYQTGYEPYGNGYHHSSSYQSTGYDGSSYEGGYDHYSGGYDQYSHGGSYGGYGGGPGYGGRGGFQGGPGYGTQGGYGSQGGYGQGGRGGRGAQQQQQGGSASAGGGGQRGTYHPYSSRSTYPY